MLKKWNRKNLLLPGVHRKSSSPSLPRRKTSSPSLPHWRGQWPSLHSTHLDVPRIELVVTSRKSSCVTIFHTRTRPLAQAPMMRSAIITQKFEHRNFSIVFVLGAVGGEAVPRTNAQPQGLFKLKLGPWLCTTVCGNSTHTCTDECLPKIAFAAKDIIKMMIYS